MMIVYMAISALIALGAYTLVAKENLIKKAIGLGLFTDGIHLLLISIGYKSAGIAPVLTRGMDLRYFSNLSVDPLPQALVLTSIVIELSITVLLLVLIIRYHSMTGKMVLPGKKKMIE